MGWVTHLYHCSDPAPWWSGHPPACWCPPPCRWRWHSWLTSTGRSSAPHPPAPPGLSPPWCWPPCLQHESEAAKAEAAPQTGLWPAEADSLSCCCCVVVNKLLLCRDPDAVVKMSGCWGRVCCSLPAHIRCFDIGAGLVVSMLNSMLRCCWLSLHCCSDCLFLHHSQYLHRQYPDNWQAWVQVPSPNQSFKSNLVKIWDFGFHKPWWSPLYLFSQKIPGGHWQKDKVDLKKVPPKICYLFKPLLYFLTFRVACSQPKTPLPLPVCCLAARCSAGRGSRSSVTGTSLDNSSHTSHQSHNQNLNWIRSQLLTSFD